MSISEQINAWIYTPTLVLSKIVHNIDDVISLGSISEKDFHFTSKNINFNSSLNSFIN